MPGIDIIQFTGDEDSIDVTVRTEGSETTSVISLAYSDYPALAQKVADARAEAVGAISRLLPRLRSEIEAIKTRLITIEDQAMTLEGMAAELPDGPAKTAIIGQADLIQASARGTGPRA